MALTIAPEQVIMGKLRAPDPEPIPSYKVAGKPVWIELDEPDHMNACHTLNDVLRGRVFIAPKQQISLTYLAISFKCKMTTGLTEREGIPKVYRWSGILFSDTIEHLNDPNGRPMTGKHEFPFSFTIPVSTPRSNIYSEFLPTSATTFEVAEGRPLPPSFQCTYALHTQRILFYIEVLAKCKGALNRDIRDELPIQVRAARPSRAPSHKMRSYQHDLVQQSGQFTASAANARRASNTESGKLFATPSNEPSAHFLLSSDFPSVLYINGPIPVQLALQYRSDISTTGNMPEVFLHKVFIRLTAWTGFRVAIKKLFGLSQILRTFDDKIDLVNTSFNPPVRFPTDGKVIRLDNELDGFFLKQGIKPSFKSCAISRWYIVKVSVELSCGGKSSVVDICKHPCQILPDLYREEAGDVVSGNIEHEEALPIYEARSDDAVEEDSEPPAFASTAPIEQENYPNAYVSSEKAPPRYSDSPK